MRTPTTFFAGSTQKIVWKNPPQPKEPGDIGVLSLPPGVTTPKPRPKRSPWTRAQGSAWSAGNSG